MLEVKDVFFLIILVSLTASISKTLFAHFNKCWRSSKFLFNGHAFMSNRDNDLFFHSN